MFFPQRKQRPAIPWTKEFAELREELLFGGQVGWVDRQNLLELIEDEEFSLLGPRSERLLREVLSECHPSELLRRAGDGSGIPLVQGLDRAERVAVSPTRAHGRRPIEADHR